MLHLDGGGGEAARRQIDDNGRTLSEAIRDGGEVVVPGPTGSYMIKLEWPWLARDRETVAGIAGRTRDLFEYLARLHHDGRFSTSFRTNPGRVTYQLPCHLKAQNVGATSADVLRLTGADVSIIERCAAVDGTWGFKKECYPLSMKVAEPLFRQIREVARSGGRRLPAGHAPGRPRHGPRASSPHPGPGRGLRASGRLNR
jgi:Fe-S oxidoreductase